jgi:hypothetical protein
MGPETGSSYMHLTKPLLCEFDSICFGHNVCRNTILKFPLIDAIKVHSDGVSMVPYHTY